jgi:PAS domain S-box-containing protein
MGESAVESLTGISVEFTEKNTIRVLLVDDDSGFLRIAKECLETQGGFQAETAGRVEEAKEKLRRERYDVIVSDYQMPEKDGLEFLRELREEGNDIPFIIFTGKGTEELAVEALNLCADGYFNKSGCPETVYCELAQSIRLATEKEKARMRTSHTRAAESQIKKALGELSRTLDAITDIAFVVDRNYRLVRVCKKAYEFLKRRPEELVGKPCYEVMHGTREPWPDCPHRKTLATGKPESAEVDDPHLGMPFLVTTSPIYDERGEFAQCLHIARDITKRKKTEQTLRASLDRYRSFIEVTGDLGWTANADGDVAEDIPSFREFTGQTYEEVKGWRWSKALHPDDLEHTARIWKDAIRRRSKYEVEYRLRRHDGVYRYFMARGVPVLKEDGSIREWVGTCIDITERKRAEQESVESQQKFAALFSGNPEATVYTDTDMQIMDINPRFTSLFGYSPDEVRGKGLIGIVVPEDLAKEGRMLDKKATEGYVYHDTLRMRKDGSLIPVSVSAAPISIQGRLAGYIGVYKDISQLKNAETKLAMTNEKLRVIGGLTRHDVRNMLLIITGNTYLNRKKLKDNPEAIEGFKDVDSACDTIVRIFDFARDYERLGVEELNYVDVEDSVQKAASLFPDIDGIKIVNECRGLTVLADSLLRQLYYNLIDNSLKHGERVTRIRIHYLESEDQLSLIYEDDGVGISSETKPKIFREGYTTGNGSGYGLYLIRKMMEVYGWTIHETGESGKGAQFTITIPRKNQAAKENYRIVRPLQNAKDPANAS